jgi:hypothetical protein
MESAKFMAIPLRHRRALEMLVEQKRRDRFGGIGIGALRDEDDVLTLEQIMQPLWERGLIEDLTQTEMGNSGKYFARITRLGEICLQVGFMLRDVRSVTEAEMKLLEGDVPASAAAKRLAQHDASEEQEAIA